MSNAVQMSNAAQMSNAVQMSNAAQMSNGTTTWTVRYALSGGHQVHYKVFHDRAAAEGFARWWEGRGEGFESVVLPR